VVDTRRRILDAALRCFIEGRYEQTTVARIRDRSRVSNGALFHHFPSKEAIADALYVESIAAFQEGLWELVRAKPRSLRAAIGGAIEHQLRWTEDHPDRARFIYQRGHLDWDGPGALQVTALNRDLAAAIRDWLSPFVERGEVRSGSMIVATAIVSGPAHAIARRWLSGQLSGPLTAYVDELADAAWAGLRGTPVRGRPATGLRAGLPAEVGRVTLELVSSDGTVVAHGHATATLTNQS
jgi:AcrR family transcriptional regulator